MTHLTTTPYPIILAIAASTSVCSLALQTPAGVFHWHSNESNKHSEQLLPAIAQLLAQAGLSRVDLIAVDVGPGAFTSVRVACGIAQGLSLGWGCLVLPVQSLTALAHQAISHIDTRSATITSVIDARMCECYVAHYALQQQGNAVVIKATSVPALVAYERVLDLGADCVIGNTRAVLPHWETLAASTLDAAPSAIGVLAAALDALSTAQQPVLPEDLQPLYVRNQVAFTTAERLAGLNK